MDSSSKEATSLDLDPPEADVNRLVEKLRAFADAKPLDPAGLFKDREFASREIRSFVQSLTGSELQGISPEVVYTMFQEIVAASTPSPIDSEADLDAAVVDRMMREADDLENESPGSLAAINDEEILALHNVPAGLEGTILNRVEE